MDNPNIVAVITEAAIIDEHGIHAKIQWVSEEKRKETEAFIRAMLGDVGESE